jgi:hypothetical protein
VGKSSTPQHEPASQSLVEIKGKAKEATQMKIVTDCAADMSGEELEQWNWWKI